ncbi:MAG: F0F1 ATP synthase subunit B [Candidatus Saccharimonadales bacterium]
MGFDGQAFLIQLVTFILAFLVLKRYAFKPVIKLLRERRETIENGVKLGEQMRQERIELEQKAKKVLREARAKADGIIAGAEETGRQAVHDAEEKARSQAEGIVTAANQRIAQDTARARRHLEQEVAGLVADATEAVLDEKVDAKKDASLIERALKRKQAA